MSKSQKRFITDEHGKQVAVVLPMADYEALVEDLHDLAVLSERREEQPLPADEFKRQLLSDGDL